MSEPQDADALAGLLGEVIIGNLRDYFDWVSLNVTPKDPVAEGIRAELARWNEMLEEDGPEDPNGLRQVIDFWNGALGLVCEESNADALRKRVADLELQLRDKGSQ